MEKQSLEKLQKRIDWLKSEEAQLEKEKFQILNSEGGSGIYSIRPAGRHVLTIGEDLIQDPCAAIIELVKNAYDADSSVVDIILSRINDEKVKISVQDRGHGMSVNDIIYKWLVPSTTNKADVRKSPTGRIMQGRKGIGRYAASILGEQFELRTVTPDGVCNKIELNWNQFENVQYLDQIGVKVESSKTSELSGTCITIVGDKAQSLYWSQKKIDKLIFELKRLMSPQKEYTDDEFKIILKLENFFELSRQTVEIVPFPILEFYDYRIYGEVTSEGRGQLLYETQKISPTVREKIDFNYGKSTNCGDLTLDIKVYDRDTESIENIIKRGLKNERTGEYLSKTETKNLINSVNGIGVYRNGFRIRPLGDPDYDWLMLNKKRVQNPSVRIGGDQVSGYVNIQSEELSHLEEKSARDGLKENDAYEELKNITSRIIEELETRRAVLRRKLGLAHPQRKIERQLNSLYDFSKLKALTKQTLTKVGLSKEAVNEIELLIDAEEKKNNCIVEEISKAVAIYQGQATIGKIINVLLHEGRRPLNYFKGQLPNMKYYVEKLKKKKDEKTIDKVIEISTGIESNAQIFVNLFSRIDPLATRRRQNKRSFSVRKVLNEVFAVFENELKQEKINTEINCGESLKFEGWSQDFYAIFTNLVDNSIFWMKEKSITKRTIIVDANMVMGKLTINYRDTGPGISDELLKSEIIFEPDFSTKPGGGVGLGLAIAGEAAERNGLKLSAEASTLGAHFVLVEKEG